MMASEAISSDTWPVRFRPLSLRAQLEAHRDMRLLHTVLTGEDGWLRREKWLIEAIAEADRAYEQAGLLTLD